MGKSDRMYKFKYKRSVIKNMQMSGPLNLILNSGESVFFANFVIARPHII